MLYQFYYFFGLLLAIPLLPILILQGKKIRATIPDLGEAQGATIGQVGKGNQPLRILILGESTMAGVGVATHKEGIANALAQQLAKDLEHPIHWQVLAKSGYTVQQVNQLLVPQIPNEPLDIIVIGLGGNDTFKLNRPLRWRRHFRQLIWSIRKRQADVPIFIANLPPVGQFPAFTPLLQFFLGGLVYLHGQILRSLPTEFPNVYYNYAPINFEQWSQKPNAPSDPAAYFSDGVHPAPITYQMWGEDIARTIIKSRKE